MLFSPDNKHLATYDGGKICVWNIVNSKIISTLVEESEAVCCIDYSSDNKMIAYGVVLKIYLFFRWNLLGNTRKYERVLTER